MTICIHNMERPNCAYCRKLDSRRPASVKARTVRPSAVARPSIAGVDLSLLVRRDLAAHPGSTAREIARRLHVAGTDVTRRDVNRTLYGPRNKAFQSQTTSPDSAPTWSVVEQGSLRVEHALAARAS